MPKTKRKPFLNDLCAPHGADKTRKVQRKAVTTPAENDLGVT